MWYWLARKAKKAKTRKPKAREVRKEPEEEEPLEEEEEEGKAIPEDRIALMYKVILEAGPQGMTQSEAWKALSLTSREGSRLAIRLERRGLINRDRVVREGRWTYLLVPLVQPLRFTSIEEAPCITCKYEPRCRPGAEINSINCPPDLYSKGIATWVWRDWTRGQMGVRAG